MIHQREIFDFAIQHPVGRLNMCHEFPEHAEASGADTVVVVSREIMQILGREQIGVFRFGDWNTLDEDFRVANIDRMVSSPPRARLARGEERT